MFSPETKEELFVEHQNLNAPESSCNAVLLTERLFNTISKTATEKYLEFLDHYPTLSQRCPTLYCFIWVFH
jgi:hypothetical protein